MGHVMRVKDVMSTVVVSVSPDNSVWHAAEIMLANQLSGLPVIHDDGAVVGIISEGDLIRRTELGRGAIDNLATADLPAEDRAQAFVRHSSWRVGDAMSRNPIGVSEEAELGHVSELMQKHGIKRLLVTRDGGLVGIVSRADLLKALVTAKRTGVDVAAGDEALGRSIAARLADTGIEGLDVKITVIDGIVHLWGDIQNEESRRAACVVAENIRGVKGVVTHFSEPSA